MSRTQLRLDCDLGYEDGMFDLAAEDFFSLGGAATLTRNAKGDISWNLASSLTGTFDCPLSGILFRTGVQDYTQNAFGAGGRGRTPYGSSTGARVGTPAINTTAAISAAGIGGAVNIPLQSSAMFTVGRYVIIDSGANQEVQVITAIPDISHITVGQLALNHASGVGISQGVVTSPAGVNGPPPFTGMTQFATSNSPRQKGILIRGFEVRYVVGTLALTSITIGLTQTTFRNGIPVIGTDILSASAYGMSTAVSTGATVWPVALVNPTYLTGDLMEYILEINAVTPATSTFRLYGVTMYVTYNYN